MGSRTLEYLQQQIRRASVTRGYQVLIVPIVGEPDVVPVSSIVERDRVVDIKYGAFGLSINMACGDYFSGPGRNTVRFSSDGERGCILYGTDLQIERMLERYAETGRLPYEPIPDPNARDAESEDLRILKYTLGISRRAPAWSEREFEIIRTRYPNEGLHIQRRCLPHRTAAAITSKACQLGVRTGSPTLGRKGHGRPKSWTIEEDDILIQACMLGLGTAEAVARLQGRTMKAVNARVKRLPLDYAGLLDIKGLDLKLAYVQPLRKGTPRADANPWKFRGGRHPDWLPHELAIMNEHYPSGGVKAVHALLPNRTISSIKQKASAMKLRMQ